MLSKCIYMYTKYQEVVPPQYFMDAAKYYQSVPNCHICPISATSVKQFEEYQATHFCVCLTFIFLHICICSARGRNVNIKILGQSRKYSEHKLSLWWHWNGNGGKSKAMYEELHIIIVVGLIMDIVTNER